MRIELLTRPRLLRSLQAALRSSHVLIIAPAGYGKTVLLRSLAAQQPHTYYLSLSSADVDLPHLRSRLEEVRQLARHAPQTTLLLDDVQHLQEGPESLDWLATQLRHRTPRLVLAGRWIPIPAIRALATERGWAILDASDLAFTPSESQVFLKQRYADTPELMATWHERTGGWPLALALLARVQATPDPRPIAEVELFAYLARTLAQTLPLELLRFWTLTAVPLRFNDELAAELLGPGGDAMTLRQEIQRHNLFLEPAEEPGWFRYHELIREFLLQQATVDLRPIFHQVVTWFEAHDDLEMAIEHALAGGLQDRAARLILQLPPEFTKIEGRVWTFRRWITSLSDDVHTAYPDLLIRLVSSVHETGGWPEARAYSERVRRLAEVTDDPALRHRALQAIGMLHFLDGDYKESLATLNQLLADPTCDDAMRARVTKTVAENLAGLGRVHEASRAYTQATELAEAVGDEALAMYARHNHIVLVLTQRGAFETARALMERNAAYVKESRPYEVGAYLVEWCELCIAMGDWDELQARLANLEALADQLEERIDDDMYWLCTYRGFLETGRGDFAKAQAALDRAMTFAGGDPLSVIWLALAQAWLFRRQGRCEDAVRHAEEALTHPGAWPAYRAALALERDIALADRDAPLHPETENLIWLRARAQLVRLRALLALRCWRRDDPRWRRHVYAALFGLKAPGYEHLLTHRDPDLGAAFWALLLAEGIAVDQAIAGLQATSKLEAVLPLLEHQAPPARVRVAQALAAIGREEAMPVLTAALSAERDREVIAALEAALTHLESQPPPPLKVKLLGDFALWRGGQPIPDGAWQRPIVRRLFQYFALHRGVPLSRDRILDDLWPQSDPQKAWTTFRTVHSRLRRVLEPYMRPKSHCRYMAVEGEIYQFDPRDIIEVDVETFEATVQGALEAAQEQDVPPLPEDLLTALEGWEPLLPELPYEEWLLEPRERLRELYIEGCLYVAQTLLIHGRPGEAADWARRTVQAAPWLEEGYQALMRAYARQGQRALALKTYNEAMEALRHELDVEPSPLTQWLAERLKRGEEV